MQSAIRVLPAGIGKKERVISDYREVPPDLSMLLDDFNRADGSLGANYYSGIVYDVHDPLEIDFQEVAALVPGQTGTSVSWWETIFNADQFVFAQMTSVPGVGSMRLWSRGQGAGSGLADGYAVFYSGGTISIERMIDEVIAQIGVVSSYTISVNEYIALRVVGSDPVYVEFWHQTGGVWKHVTTVSDGSASRVTASGKIGLEITDSGGRWDNFGGGNADSADSPIVFPRMAPTFVDQTFDVALQTATVEPYTIQNTRSDKVVRVYQLNWYISSEAVQATGAFPKIQVWRGSQSTTLTGTAVVTNSMDTNDVLPSGIVAFYNPTAPGFLTEVNGRVLVSGDEMTVSGAYATDGADMFSASEAMRDYGIKLRKMSFIPDEPQTLRSNGTLHELLGGYISTVTGGGTALGGVECLYTVRDE